MNFLFLLFATALGNRRFRHFKNFHQRRENSIPRRAIIDRADKIAIGNLLTKFGYDN